MILKLQSFLPLVGLLVVNLVPVLASAADPTTPISLHPDNAHYFVWRGEPTMLITSGEHYGALLNLDFDYARYFETLSVDGLNHTRTFSGVYREVPSSFGITDNPLAPKPQRYICPWPRSSEPGYFDGGNKFDLSRWDDAYFARLHDFMRQAQQRGIVVELTLFCPMYREDLWQACPMNAANNINGLGDFPRDELYTLEHDDITELQLAVTKKIVGELLEYDNLYYEVCNEPYQRRTSLAWQHKIVEAIVAAEQHLPADRRHLISMNIANDKAKVVDPHPAVSIFNFHYCVPPETVAMNYQLNKVIGENETGFRGKDDILYRTEGWDFLLAGGALYNNLDYSFTPGHADGSLLDYKSPGGGSPALRKQLGILKRFLERFDFIRMRPDNSIIRRVSPKLTASALVDPGHAYAMYLHVPLPKKPQDVSQLRRTGITADLEIELPTGSYFVEWMDTKTGLVISSGNLDSRGGIAEFSTPRFDDDVAVRIVAKK